MSTPKIYKFTTLQELFDVVPAERMRECMDELAELFVSSKSHLETVAEALKLLGRDVPDSLATLPTPMEWIDDGAREITARFTAAEGGPVLYQITNKP